MVLANASDAPAGIANTGFLDGMAVTQDAEYLIAGSQTGKFKRAVLDKLGVEAAVRGEIDIFDENAVEQVTDIVHGGGCVNIQRVVAFAPAGIANTGFLDGMAVTQDAEYLFSIYARGLDGYKGAIHVDLMARSRRGSAEMPESALRVFRPDLCADRLHVRGRCPSGKEIPYLRRRCRHQSSPAGKHFSKR